VLEAEPGQQAGDVVLHGLLGEVELLGDLPVGHALGDEEEDLALLRRELADDVERLALHLHLLDDAVGDRGIDERVAAGDQLDAVEQGVALDPLEHVARRAREDGRGDGVRVVVRREDEGPDVRVDRAHLAADVDTGAVGQVRVEDGDVGPQLEDLAQRHGRAARLPDQLELGVGREQARHTPADDLVVVDDVDADRILGWHDKDSPAPRRRGRPLEQGRAGGRVAVVRMD
jgi:hypothetical protein